MHEMPRTRVPWWRAAIASGTVDIPTASAPSSRYICISDGVSYVGPDNAAINAAIHEIGQRFIDSVFETLLGDVVRRFAGDMPKFEVVNLAHVGKTRPETHDRLVPGEG